MGLYFVLPPLLITMISSLIMCKKRNDNITWPVSYISLAISFIILIAIGSYKMFTSTSIDSFDTVSLLLNTMLFYVGTVIMYIVVIVTNLLNIEKGYVIHYKVLIVLLSIMIITIPVISSHTTKIDRYLNDMYGEEGNFYIKKVRRKSKYKYNFYICSEYMDDNFVLTIDYKNKEILNDTFLDEYYDEKHSINDLEEYLSNALEKEINSIIKDKEIQVEVKSFKINIDKYKHIPTLKELKKNGHLTISKIIITKDSLNKYKENIETYLKDYLSKEYNISLLIVND